MKWRPENNAPTPKIGLVLPGGGARAAYQVGVLRAIAKILPKGTPCPFAVITGTSAGSINATALAIHARDFRKGVFRISRVWKNFRSHHVFRTDPLGIARTGAHWLASMMLGGLGKYNPSSLLDRSPLHNLLSDSLAYEKIQESINSGALHALGISASNYSTGQSTVFFQGVDSLKPWNKGGRIGCRTAITFNHLLASSAIPLVFSATRINNSYYGDGSMRQLAPLSPALHLGADRLFVVGIRKPVPFKQENERAASYPSMAEIASHVLNSIFLDNLDPDLERLERINKTISLIPNRRIIQGGVTLRPVDVLTISPSEDIGDIAQRHANLLPRTLRFLLRGIGAFGNHNHGSTLLSYLMFEKTYCRELIALGYKDAMRAKDEILQFLDTSTVTQKEKKAVKA
ncbi:MAG TPA: patatin-like phospholipase family protein [Gammaproteobacteria bacterium]